MYIICYTGYNHFLLITSQLKTQYRSLYSSLQLSQSEVQYCRQYVDETRHRLLTEFDQWYKESFIGDLDIGSLPGSKKVQLLDA